MSLSLLYVCLDGLGDDPNPVLLQVRGQRFTVCDWPGCPEGGESGLASG